MAFGFGRKKAANDAPASPDATSTPDSTSEAAPVAAHAPSSPQGEDLDAFDLDSFADLPTAGAQVDADPFGDLGAFSQGATPQTSGSAFDFPATPEPQTTIVETTTVDGTNFEATPFEPTPFDAPDFVTTDFEAPNAEAPNAEAPNAEATTLSATETSALDLDEMFGIEQANAARIANSNLAPAPLVPPSAPMPEEAVPFYEPQIPVETGAQAEMQPKKKAPLAPILGALAVLALAGGAATYFTGQSAPDSETEAAAPVPAPETVAPEAVAPEVAPAQPKAPAKAVAAPAVASAASQLSQMKALWKRGADAKHRGDYDAARSYWNQGLKIQPSNIGFQESIAKLPQ